MNEVSQTPQLIDYLLFDVPPFTGHRILRGVLDDLVTRAAGQAWRFAPYYDYSTPPPEYQVDPTLVQAHPDLANLPSLRDATQIVLAGSSAGAVGALVHAEYVEAFIMEAWQRENPSRPLSSWPLQQLRLIIDSGWFLDYYGQFGVIATAALQSWSIPSAEFVCMAPERSVGELINGAQPIPCCFLAHCVAPYLPARIHALFVQSMYDAFLLSLGATKLLGNLVPSLLPSSLGQGTMTSLVDIVTLLNNYGGAYNQSMASMNAGAHSNIHFFVPACLQHVYIPAQIMQLEVEVSGFSMNVSDVSWVSVTVDGATVQQAVSRFLRRSDLGLQASVLQLMGDLPAPVRLVDRATGPQANPTCPDQFNVDTPIADFDSPSMLWGDETYRQFLLGFCWAWMLLPVFTQWTLWIASIAMRRRFQGKGGKGSGRHSVADLAQSPSPNHLFASQRFGRNASFPVTGPAASPPKPTLTGEQLALTFEDIFYWPTTTSRFQECLSRFRHASGMDEDEDAEHEHAQSCETRVVMDLAEPGATPSSNAISPSAVRQSAWTGMAAPAHSTPMATPTLECDASSPSAKTMRLQSVVPNGNDVADMALRSLSTAELASVREEVQRASLPPAAATLPHITKESLEVEGTFQVQLQEIGDRTNTTPQQPSITVPTSLVPRSTLRLLSSPILRGVSGHVSMGQLVAIMGASGSGSLHRSWTR